MVHEDESPSTAGRARHTPNRPETTFGPAQEEDYDSFDGNDKKDGALGPGALAVTRLQARRGVSAEKETPSSPASRIAQVFARGRKYSPS